MKKAVTSIVFALALSLGGGAVAYGDAGTFATGVSFDGMTAGEHLKLGLVEGGSGTMPEGVYWLYGERVSEVSNTVVTAHEDGTYGNYLELGMAPNETLMRCAMPMMLDPTGVYVPSNAWLKTSEYDGVCTDLRVRFTAGESNTVIALDEKLYLRLDVDSVANVTNLVIGAGTFDGSFNRVANREYVVESPAVKPGEWCRLTIRAHSNALRPQELTPVPFCTVYLDRQPVIATPASYSVGSGYREDLLSTQARVLISERRLLPFAAPANAVDASTYIQGLLFSGAGAIDDIMFTTTMPDFVTDASVFTLQWNGGVKSFDCIVSNRTAEIARRSFGETDVSRSHDFVLDSDRYARVTVANVVTDEEHGYDGHVLDARSECVLDGESFVYAGERDVAAYPVGALRATSSSGGILVGGRSYPSFAEAKVAAAKGDRRMVLGEDLVIGVRQPGEDVGDLGLLEVGAGEDLVLDLNGHTLQGRLFVPHSATIEVCDSGRLEIVDSVGDGRVLPPLSADPEVGSDCVIGLIPSRNPAAAANPRLVIGGGIYDGEVLVAHKTPTDASGKLRQGECIVDGGSFIDLTGESDFYLEQFVTNTTAYFTCSGGYWSHSATGFIWSGKGLDDSWTRPSNWRCYAVPGINDTVIFPHTTNAWQVNYGALRNNPTNYIMDGDVEMSGSALFGDVRISGDGLFEGDGSMLFTGKLPVRPNLSAKWKGTVKVSEITENAILNNLGYWGVAGSKVEFVGVRGYVKDTKNHSQPYELVLTDQSSTVPAWKNETGYTGSTISFAKLTGSGTLDSPANTRTVNQVLKFVDVTEFTGKFVVGGKRVLVGDAAPATAGPAGCITFSDGVRVRSGRGWKGVLARFGGTLEVVGKIDDVLVDYTGDIEPAVEDVAVTLYDSAGNPSDCRLVALDGKVYVRAPLVESSSLKLNGVEMSADEAISSARSGMVIAADASLVVDADNRLYVNGKYVGDFAGYYTLEDLGDGTYLLKLDRDEVAPTLAAFSLADGIRVENSVAGLYYTLQSAAELRGPWTDRECLAGDGGTLVFGVETSGEDSLFYRVVVTDTP